MSAIYRPKILAISLEANAARVLFGSVFLLASLACAAAAVRAEAAGIWGASLTSAGIEKAIRIDGANSELLDRLGLIYAWIEDKPDAAIASLRRATELTPANAQYWLDLAKVSEILPNTHYAEQASLRAASLAPMIPRYRWQLASHYFVTGESQKALQAVQQYLSLEPEDANLVFGMVARVLDQTDPVWQMLSQVGRPEVRAQYVAFLLASGQSPAAMRYWHELVSQKAQVPQSIGVRAVENLLARRDVQDARLIWNDLQELGALPPQSGANLVFNDDFAMPFLDAGFDWHQVEQPFCQMVRTGDGVRVDFTAPSNSDFRPLYQLIPVLPNHQYSVSARVRSNEITSDSGPTLRVEDALCPQCLDVQTETTTGTAPWHAIATAFTTGQQTNLIRLSIWRARGRSFPSDISGSFWISDVSLVQVR